MRIVNESTKMQKLPVLHPQSKVLGCDTVFDCQEVHVCQLQYSNCPPECLLLFPSSLNLSAPKHQVEHPRFFFNPPIQLRWTFQVQNHTQSPEIVSEITHFLIVDSA